jgi:hypothetical protein
VAIDRRLIACGAFLFLTGCDPEPTAADKQQAAIQEALAPAPETGAVVDQNLPGARKADFMMYCAQAMITATKAVPALTPAHMHSPWRLSSSGGTHPRIKCEVYGGELGDGYVEAAVRCSTSTNEPCSRPLRVVLGGKTYFPPK